MRNNGPIAIGLESWSNFILLQRSNTFLEVEPSIHCFFKAVWIFLLVIILVITRFFKLLFSDWLLIHLYANLTGLDQIFEVYNFLISYY